MNVFQMLVITLVAAMCLTGGLGLPPARVQQRQDERTSNDYLGQGQGGPLGGSGAGGSAAVRRRARAQRLRVLTRVLNRAYKQLSTTDLMLLLRSKKNVNFNSIQHLQRGADTDERRLSQAPQLIQPGEEQELQIWQDDQRPLSEQEDEFIERERLRRHRQQQQREQHRQQSDHRHHQQAAPYLGDDGERYPDNDNGRYLDDDDTSSASDAIRLPVDTAEDEMSTKLKHASVPPDCPMSDAGTQMFACPTPDKFGRFKCINDHNLCDNKVHCPRGEDEDKTVCMFHKMTMNYFKVLMDAIFGLSRSVL